MEMSDQIFSQILWILSTIRTDNPKVDGLFREYNKHVAFAVRAAEFNEDSRFDEQRVLNTVCTEHYKAHSLINYRTNVFADSIYYKIRLPACLQLDKKIMLSISYNDVINRFVHFQMNIYVLCIITLRTCIVAYENSYEIPMTLSERCTSMLSSKLYKISE